MKDIHDVITHAKFGDDCLRGSGVVAGQISAFPIDFAGRPYNTLTLPCERVIKDIYIAQVHKGHKRGSTFPWEGALLSGVWSINNFSAFTLVVGHHEERPTCKK